PNNSLALITYWEAPTVNRATSWEIYIVVQQTAPIVQTLTTAPIIVEARFGPSFSLPIPMQMTTPTDGGYLVPGQTTPIRFCTPFAQGGGEVLRGELVYRSLSGDVTPQ